VSVIVYIVAWSDFFEAQRWGMAAMSSFAAGASAPLSPLSMRMFDATIGLVFIDVIALVVLHCLPGAKGLQPVPHDSCGANVDEVFA
jgi:hypothetical protein